MSDVRSVRNGRACSGASAATAAGAVDDGHEGDSAPPARSSSSGDDGGALASGAHRARGDRSCSWPPAALLNPLIGWLLNALQLQETSASAASAAEGSMNARPLLRVLLQLIQARDSRHSGLEKPDMAALTGSI